MRYRGNKPRHGAGRFGKHEKRDFKRRFDGAGPNSITGPVASIYTSGSTSEWVLKVKPDLDTEIRKENLMEYFSVPAGIVVAAGIPIVEKTFDEPEMVEATWIQGKMDAALAIETARSASWEAAMMARFPINAVGAGSVAANAANVIQRTNQRYDESLKVIDNRAKIELKRSDFEREFHALKEAREKRKIQHEVNVAKCLKTVTARIGASILMRVDGLMRSNSWRQVYYDLNVMLTGTTGGHEHKEAILKILQNSVWNGKQFDDFITELNRVFQQVEAAGSPVNDELRQYHLRQAIKNYSRIMSFNQ